MLAPDNVAVRRLSQMRGFWRRRCTNGVLTRAARGSFCPMPMRALRGGPRAAAMNEVDLAEYCRKRGLFPEQIRMWRGACEQANDWDRTSAARMSPATKDEKKRIKELERELARKEKAVAETADLLVLRKRRRQSGEGDEGNPP